MSASADSIPVAAIRRVGAVGVFLGQILARIPASLGKPSLLIAQVYNAGARSLVIVMPAQ